MEYHKTNHANQIKSSNKQILAITFFKKIKRKQGPKKVIRDRGFIGPKCKFR